MDDRPAIPASDTAPPPWPILIVLIAASTLSFIDRQILSLLVDPISAALDIDDFEMGLLAGPAFAVFYAVAGLPLGWLADRVDRGRLIAAGIAAWSAMTALSGFASSYAQLFLARIGVGVGEASLGPAAQSLIGERFAGPRLPLAMSIFSTGVALGSGLAFALGGQVVALASGPARHLPGLGTLAPWQLTFVIVGLPGLLVALAVALLVRDPRKARTTPQPAMFDGLAAFWRAQPRLITLFLCGISLVTAAGYATLLWLPSVFIRSFGWTAPQIGTVIGIMLMTLGVGGVMTFGAIATRVIRRGRSDGTLRVTALAAALSVPFAASTLMPDATTTLVLLAPGLLISSAFIGLGPATIQSITPPDLRGRAAAISLMITSLFGMVAGPVGVGALTTLVFKDPGMVGVSLALVSGTLSALGALCLWKGLGSYRTALAAHRGAPAAG